MLETDASEFPGRNMQAETEKRRNGETGNGRYRGSGIGSIQLALLLRETEDS